MFFISTLQVESFLCESAATGGAGEGRVSRSRRKQRQRQRPGGETSDTSEAARSKSAEERKRSREYTKAVRQHVISLLLFCTLWFGEYWSKSEKTRRLTARQPEDVKLSPVPRRDPFTGQILDSPVRPASSLPRHTPATAPSPGKGLHKQSSEINPMIGSYRMGKDGKYILH